MIHKRVLGLVFRLSHTLATGPWVRDLNSVHLRVLIFKLQVIIMLTSQGCCKDYTRKSCKIAE